MFINAWDTGDNEELRRTMKFPFVTVGPNGRVIVTETPNDFSANFAGMREREGWHHSRLDRVEATWVSEDKVNFRVDWSRHLEEGSTTRVRHADVASSHLSVRTISLEQLPCTEVVYDSRVSWQLRQNGASGRAFNRGYPMGSWQARQ